jgi:hypothetical protein
MATPQSFALITGRLSASESDLAKRQSAASTIGHALQLPAVKDFNAVDLAAVIRAITTAANAETQTTVVVQQLRALSIVATRDDVQAASAALARTNQITIVRGILTSIAANPKPDRRMVVVARAIAELQEQWTKLTSEASTLGPMIAPLLTETLQVGSKQWDAAHGESDEADLYTETIAAAEVLLRVIDARLRSKAGEVSPASAIANAWKAGDKKAYDELVAKWSAALNGPPYK